MARATNDGLDVPLGDSEVSAIAKSVERYRRSWIAKGRFYTEAERTAWGRSLGLQSAAVRRAANAQRDLRIRDGHAAGWSQRHLAKLFKMSQHGVWKCYSARVVTVLHRLRSAGDTRTTQIVSLLSLSIPDRKRIPSHCESAGRFDNSIAKVFVINSCCSGGRVFPTI